MMCDRCESRDDNDSGVSPSGVGILFGVVQDMVSSWGVGETEQQRHTGKRPFQFFALHVSILARGHPEILVPCHQGSFHRIRIPVANGNNEPTR